jgi:hypothetical protein
MARTDTDRAPILCTRTRQGLLAPASAFDAERLERIATGSTVEVTIRQRRSLPQLRLYWAVLGKCVENMDGYPSSEHLHDALKLHLGYTSPIKRVTGETVWIPNSTAFSAMDAAEFKVFFDRAMETLAMMLGVDPLTLAREATDA